jgi:signal transduction histidine kinase
MGLAAGNWNAGAFQPVTFTGQVIHCRDNEYFIMDSTRGVRFVPKEPIVLSLGDDVLVTGLPDTVGPSTILRESVVKKLGHHDLPKPFDIPWDDPFRAEYDATLVHVAGILAGVGKESGDRVLDVHLGAKSFVVRYHGDSKMLESLPLNARVELTGVYLARGGKSEMTEYQVQAFDVLLNAPSDCVVFMPPTWWTLRHSLMMAGCLVCVLALAARWIQSLRRQVAERNARLQAEIQKRERVEHQRLLEAERARIARDLHDDLGSSLTEISMLSETGRDCPPAGENPRSRFDCILQRSHSMVRALDEIVWAVDPKKDSLASLARYLAGFAEEYFTSADLTCRVNIPTSLPDWPLEAETRHHLFMAVKEAVHNAVRHASATEVVFNMTVNETGFEISVADNGRGFDLSLQPSGKGRGLNNLCKRLEDLGGQCEVRSAPGKGTTLVMKMPLKHAEVAVP